MLDKRHKLRFSHTVEGNAIEVPVKARIKTAESRFLWHGTDDPSFRMRLDQGEDPVCGTKADGTRIWLKEKTPAYAGFASKVLNRP